MKMIISKIIILLIFLEYGYCTDRNDTQLESNLTTETTITFPSTNSKSDINTNETTNSSKNETSTIPTSLQNNDTTPLIEINLTKTSENLSNTTTSVSVTAVIYNETSELTTPSLLSICPAECKCAVSLVDAVCTGQGLNDIPIGFSSHVKMLILTSNNITEIGENSFKERNLYELMSLLINHNHIHSLHPHAFAVLKDLEVLDLGDNNLATLSPDLFVTNMALTTLRLDNNTKLQIPAYGALINAPSLHDLNISSCNISFLTNDIFSGTPTLDTIDLSGNNLKELNPIVLKSLPDLITLLLPKSFEPKVNELCLAHEKLEKIVIINKGNEENIQCAELSPNIELKTPEINIPLNGNQNLQINNQTDYNVSSLKIPDENLDKVIISTEEISDLKVQMPPQEDKINRIIDQNNEQKMKPVEGLNTASNQGLSGSQIDNIIIGILLTVITITGVAIIINLNKKKFDKVFRKRRQPSEKNNEPEGEPLQNMVSNP